MKFHGYLFLKILTPMVRRLLPCTNEEYMAIAICLEMMLIYQGLILVLKKNKQFIFIDPKIGLEHLVREFLNMGVCASPR